MEIRPNSGVQRLDERGSQKMPETAFLGPYANIEALIALQALGGLSQNQLNQTIGGLQSFAAAFQGTGTGALLNDTINALQHGNYVQGSQLFTQSMQQYGYKPPEPSDFQDPIEIARMLLGPLAKAKIAYENGANLKSVQNMLASETAMYLQNPAWQAFGEQSYGKVAQDLSQLIGNAISFVPTPDNDYMEAFFNSALDLAKGIGVIR